MRARWVPRRPAALIERALLVFGIACLGYYGYMTAEAHQFQREQRAAMEAVLESTPAARGSASYVAPVALAAPGGAAPARRPASPAESVTSGPQEPTALGLLDIPRLKISTPVLPGDDDETLDVAVGHLPDTPKPWEPGNSAFAAHRDGLFRPLRNIRVGDAIEVRTIHGEFSYRVRETKIVAPDDLSVLAPTDEQTLTLITCYPFNYVGNAPKRFIVHADRIAPGTQ